jgi:protein subunit release factor B
MSGDSIITVLAKDCEWNYERGTGAGGQKRNKTESKVRCTHRASGAVGISDLTRSQHQNKRLAFTAMAKTPEMQKWLKLETARQLGTLKSVEETVDIQMKNIAVEVKKNGKWVKEELHPEKVEG